MVTSIARPERCDHTFAFTNHVKSTRLRAYARALARLISTYMHCCAERPSSACCKDYGASEIGCTW